jgi:hypothetical protein
MNHKHLSQPLTDFLAIEAEEAKVGEGDRGLQLKPSKPHIKKLQVGRECG